jgi:hypothetical protein
MFRPMPRKARADHLKVVSLCRPRPEPPKDLDAAEARSWKAIVDASPDGFLDSAAQLLLRQVCAQIAIADRHAERLRALAAQPDDQIEAELAIADAHRKAMAAIIVGMTTLRATPRSRMRPRDAGRAFDRSVAAGDARPWEVRAPLTEGEARDDGDASA